MYRCKDIDGRLNELSYLCNRIDLEYVAKHPSVLMDAEDSFQVQISDGIIFMEHKANITAPRYMM